MTPPTSAIFPRPRQMRVSPGETVPTVSPAAATDAKPSYHPTGSAQPVYPLDGEVSPSGFSVQTLPPEQGVDRRPRGLGIDCLVDPNGGSAQ